MDCRWAGLDFQDVLASSKKVGTSRILYRLYLDTSNNVAAYFTCTFQATVSLLLALFYVSTRGTGEVR